MWAEIEKIIERLLRSKDLGVESVSEVLDVKLEITTDSPLARYYHAQIPAEPLRDVELRFIPETGVSFLVLRPHPDRPIVVSPDNLRNFGIPKWRSIEPKASPEGEVAECFDIDGIELRVGYRTKSRQLEAISLGSRA